MECLEVGCHHFCVVSTNKCVDGRLFKTDLQYTADYL